MQTEPDSTTPKITIETHTELLMRGSLVVQTTWEDGQIVSEVFTFACLAGVLGLRESVVESRYHRLGLSRWAVLVPTGLGRKVRAFPMELRDEVLGLLSRTGGRDRREPFTGVQRFVPELAANCVGSLDVTFWRGNMYLTVQALADCFGVTPQTIRTRMKASGLWSEFVPLLRARAGTGRPAMALPHGLAGDAMIVMRERAVGGLAAWRVLLRRATADGTTRRAQQAMEAAMNIPTADPLALDPERDKPIPGLDTLCAEIERALA